MVSNATTRRLKDTSGKSLGTTKKAKPLTKDELAADNTALRQRIAELELLAACRSMSSGHGSTVMGDTVVNEQPASELGEDLPAAATNRSGESPSPPTLKRKCVEDPNVSDDQTNSSESDEDSDDKEDQVPPEVKIELEWDVDGKLCKPKGSHGKRYNIQKLLKIEDLQWNIILSDIREEVGLCHISKKSKDYRKLEPVNLGLLFTKIAKAHPVMSKCQDSWATSELVRQYLQNVRKNRTKAERAKAKQDAEKAKLPAEKVKPCAKKAKRDTAIPETIRVTTKATRCA